MWLPLMLLSQLSAEPQPPRIVIDLLPKPCVNSEQSNEIVVCGRREEPYRIGPMIPEPPALPEAKIGIGENATLAAEAQRGNVGDIPTNRAMVTIKIKF